MTKICLLTLVLILAGCATGSSYHSWDDRSKLGYSDAQLNETVYRVSYTGWGIPQNECDDFAIMRASEISKEKGYKYFRILTEKQSSQTQPFYFSRSIGRTDTISPNYTFSTITIEMLKEKRKDASDILDADIIWNSLAKRHGVGK
ncbi:MAG: hypothetical protein OER43_04860 [Gammaproteobacteria bacterium]|nr:hypothetical protein [Gammaproteobacteria bacterium]MDH3412964.1 hypothetical protein [Gammaproteobacteria bacterium]